MNAMLLVMTLAFAGPPAPIPDDPEEGLLLRTLVAANAQTADAARRVRFDFRANSVIERSRGPWFRNDDAGGVLREGDRLFAHRVVDVREGREGDWGAPTTRAREVLLVGDGFLFAAEGGDRPIGSWAEGSDNPVVLEHVRRVLERGLAFRAPNLLAGSWIEPLARALEPPAENARTVVRATRPGDPARGHWIERQWRRGDGEWRPMSRFLLDEDRGHAVVFYEAFGPAGVLRRETTTLVRVPRRDGTGFWHPAEHLFETFRDAPGDGAPGSSLPRHITTRTTFSKIAALEPGEAAWDVSMLQGVLHEGAQVGCAYVDGRRATCLFLEGELVPQDIVRRLRAADAP